MDPKEMLTGISNEARGWLKAWARDFTDAEALQPVADPRAPNPLAWHLGHLACVEEDVTLLFSPTPPAEGIVPQPLRSVCATGSPAPSAGTRYPPLQDLWALVDRTHERLLGLLEGAQPADLDRPARIANPYFHTMGQGIYKAALHENYHVGEIVALRKLLGKPRIG